MIFNIIPSLPPSQLSFLIILIKQPPELQWKISNNLTSLAALLKSFSPVSCSETVKILPSWAQWWSLIIVTTAISVISSEQGAECGLNGAMHNYLLSRNFTSHKANRPLYPLSTPQTPSPPNPSSTNLSTVPRSPGYFIMQDRNSGSFCLSHLKPFVHKKCMSCKSSSRAKTELDVKTWQSSFVIERVR